MYWYDIPWSRPWLLRPVSNTKVQGQAPREKCAKVTSAVNYVNDNMFIYSGKVEFLKGDLCSARHFLRQSYMIVSQIMAHARAVQHEHALFFKGKQYFYVSLLYCWLAKNKCSNCKAKYGRSYTTALSSSSETGIYMYMTVSEQNHQRVSFPKLYH